MLGGVQVARSGLQLLWGQRGVWGLIILGLDVGVFWLWRCPDCIQRSAAPGPHKRAQVGRRAAGMHGDRRPQVQAFGSKGLGLTRPNAACVRGFEGAVLRPIEAPTDGRW